MSKNIKEKFIEFCEESALYGESNNNGADRYHCPSCYARIDIKGYCCSTTGINYIDHEDHCSLNNMYKLIKEELEK